MSKLVLRPTYTRIPEISKRTFSSPSSKSAFSQREVVRIYRVIICHLTKLWKAKFFILCDVIFLARLQDKSKIDQRPTVGFIETESKPNFKICQLTLPAGIRWSTFCRAFFLWTGLSPQRWWWTHWSQCRHHLGCPYWQRPWLLMTVFLWLGEIRPFQISEWARCSSISLCREWTIAWQSINQLFNQSTLI